MQIPLNQQRSIILVGLINKLTSGSQNIGCNFLILKRNNIFFFLFQRGFCSLLKKYNIEIRTFLREKILRTIRDTKLIK